MWLQLSAGFSSVSHESRAAGLFLAAMTLAVASALAACGGPSDEDSAEAAAESVAAILEDGIVTDEEYEAAFFRMYDCVAESGIEVSAPGRDADGQFGFVIYGIDDLETSPSEARYWECEALHYREVLDVWIEQNGIGVYEGEGTLEECLFGPEAGSMSLEEIEREAELLSTVDFDACF